jgi:hypothetical protein
MRSLGVRLPILAVTAWAGIGLSVWGSNFRYGETVYVAPTTATFAVPTSYSASQVYVEPTAYSFPSYLPTAYAYEPVTTSTYLTTAYRVRRGLLGRLRVVERPALASYATRYMPTTYFSTGFYPTSYRATTYLPSMSRYAPAVYEDSGEVWESSYASRASSDCEQVAWNAPAMTIPPVTYAAPAASYPAPVVDGGSRSVASESAAEPPLTSRVSPAPVDERPSGNAAQDSSKVAPSGVRADSPPAVPAAPRQQSTAQPTGAANGGSAGTSAPPKVPAGLNPAPPAAPGADPTEPDLKPAPIDNPAANRRESLRPSFTSRTTRPEARNVLMGRVESDAGEPLSEVPVSATSRDGRSTRRADTTDAFGNFAIRLDDGEWTVNVQKPSGRVFPIRTVTVKNGKVVDNEEQREVRNLIISY